MRLRLMHAAQIVLLAAVYFVTGKLGLLILPVSGYATLVWPPAGISLAALLLFGYRRWPGIALGACAINLSLGASFVTALGIAAGNTGEALLGAFLLRRYFDLHLSLDRSKDALALLSIGGLLCTTIAATVGTTSLWLSGMIARATFSNTWLAWWVGDGLSNLIVAPFILVWASHLLTPAQPQRNRATEVTLLVLSLSAVSLLIYNGNCRTFPGNDALDYLTFPLIIWAALRFGQRGAVSLGLALSALVIWGTLRSVGLLSSKVILSNLYMTQIYQATSAATAVILASVIAERQSAKAALALANRELESKVLRRTAQLHESEQRFRLLVAGIKDYAIYMLDSYGTITTWNDGARQIKGYTAHEVLGRHYSLFYTPDDLALGKPTQHLKTALLTGRCEHQSWRARKDGSLFLAHIVITPVRQENDELLGYSVFTGDITDRKRHEDALARSASLLHATLESTADGILVVERSGKITIFNQRFANLWQLPRAILESKENGAALNAIRNQLKDPQGFLKKTEEVNSEQGLESFDLIELKDGRVFERYSRPQMLGQEYVGRVWSFRDISARHRAEREKEEFLNRELNAHAQALNAIRTRDELVAMISHDLKTPLSGILLIVQLLEKGDFISERGRRPVELLKRSTQFMVRLTQDLLDVHKIEGGCFSVEAGARPHQLRTVIQAVLETLQILLDEKKLRLEVELPQTLPEVIINPERMQQVLQNLIGNAIKFTPPGGLITIKAEADGPNLVCSIHDSCPGIDQELLPYVFNRFLQAKKTAQLGTGLGLTITKGIIEAHGGHIWVKNQSGGGCTFFFTLPVAVAQEARKTA